jgi:hypothetical protein
MLSSNCGNDPCVVRATVVLVADVVEEEGSRVCRVSSCSGPLSWLRVQGDVACSRKERGELPSFTGKDGRTQLKKNPRRVSVGRAKRGGAAISWRNQGCSDAGPSGVVVSVLSVFVGGQCAVSRRSLLLVPDDAWRLQLGAKRMAGRDAWKLRLPHSSLDCRGPRSGRKGACISTAFELQ